MKSAAREKGDRAAPAAAAAGAPTETHNVYYYTCLIHRVIERQANVIRYGRLSNENSPCRRGANNSRPFTYELA